jgi:hypothetical protein
MTAPLAWLPTRARHTLGNAGFQTCEAILDAGDAELSSIPGIGKGTMEKIKARREAKAMTYEGDFYTLSSGRRFYANNGILGLAPGDRHLNYGADGGADFYDYPLTPAERREIAEFMIEIWQQWAEATT